MNNTEDYRTLQNTSEDYSNIQKTSEEFNDASKRNIGIGRGKKYPGTDIPESEFERTDFIIMEEAYMLFEGKGERRSVRMIAEYCKTGELICLYDSDDKRWHISKESVANKIEKIKALNARKVQSEPQITSQKSSEEFNTDKVSQNNTYKKEEVGNTYELEQKIKDLEKENIDLKITNRGKDYFIEQLQEDRKQLSVEREQFVKDLVGFSKRIGVLETQLYQLEAPKDVKNFQPIDYSEAPVTNSESSDHQPQQAQTFYEHRKHEEPQPPHTNYQPKVEEPLQNQNNYEQNHERVSIHPNSSGEQNHFSAKEEYPRQ
jgi:hypothetical protein